MTNFIFLGLVIFTLVISVKVRSFVTLFCAFFNVNPKKSYYFYIYQEKINFYKNINNGKKINFK